MGGNFIPLLSLELLESMVGQRDTSTLAMTLPVRYGQAIKTLVFFFRVHQIGTGNSNCFSIIIVPVPVLKLNSKGADDQSHTGIFT